MPKRFEMKTKLTLLFMLSVPGLAQTSQELTLEEAIQIGLQHSRVIAISDARIAAGNAHSEEMSARLYPSLAFAGSYSRIEDGAFRLSTTNLPQPIQVGNVVVDNYAFRIGLRQPLFTGFRLSEGAESANALASAAGFDRAMTAEDVVFQISTRYWMLYQTRLLHDYSVQNVARLRVYLDDTRHLVESGMATANDLLKIDVQLLNARLAEIEARNAAVLDELRLNNAMGQEPTTRLFLSSVPSYGMPGDSLESETLLNQAYAQRGDLLAATSRVRAAEAGVNMEEGGWWPQIELSANYLYNNPHGRYQPITPEFLGTWDVGVSLTFDIWNWGITRSKVEKAEAHLREAELAEIQLRDAIVLEVCRAILDLNRSKEKLSVADLSVRQAEENQKSTERKYRAGLTTAAELLDAEVALLYAQTQHSSVQADLAIADAALRRALGGLSKVGRHE
jgi:outer membrane protein TolC